MELEFDSVVMIVMYEKMDDAGSRKLKNEVIVG